jgi:hypothetical protein
VLEDLFEHAIGIRSKRPRSKLFIVKSVTSKTLAARTFWNHVAIAGYRPHHVWGTHDS